jgi:hypothetical protein
MQCQPIVSPQVRVVRLSLPKGEGKGEGLFAQLAPKEFGALWRRLRNRNFAGYKFRHQHLLDCYILDFYCPTAKLAIELDGGGPQLSSQTNSRSNTVGIFSLQRDHCAAVL